MQEPPPQKTYTYPTEYASTAAYEELLREQSTEWSRETGILNGRMSAGVGTDYPGDRGSEDRSGLLTTTVEKASTVEEAHVLDRAIYESCAEEYEDPDGFVDPIDRLSEHDTDQASDLDDETPSYITSVNDEDEEASV